MPLHTTQSTQHSQLADPSVQPKFLIFFGSGTPSWCPDCVEAQPAVEAVFGRDSSSSGSGGADANGYMLVYDKPDWRDPNCAARVHYKVRCVPTVLAFAKGEEVARLEDVPACADEKTLREFVEDAIKKHGQA